jgi:acetylornithine/N-succinyldiaminopimelate aminotransferase
VGNAVLDVLLADGFLDNVVKKAAVLREKLQGLARRHPAVLSDVRGMGLLLGVKCVVPNTEMTVALRQAGLLTVTAGDNVLRVLPPLIIEQQHIDEAIGIMDQVCAAWPAATAAKVAGAAAR